MKPRVTQSGGCGPGGYYVSPIPLSRRYLCCSTYRSRSQTGLPRQLSEMSLNPVSVYSFKRHHDLRALPRGLT